MPHETALIGTVAVGLGLAFVLGFGVKRVGLPPLVGYLLAGVAIGPFTPGFVGHTGLAQQLAEIGVILLMFGVGIHFSVADLLAVRRVALPGAIAQIALATILGAVVAHLWGWSWGAGIVFGVCLSVASTVVLLRALEDRGLIDSVDGRIAIGWLIVEDLATVLVLVLLPAFAAAMGKSPEAEGASDAVTSGPPLLVTLGITLAKVGAFVALMFVVGRRAVPWLLEQVARTGSRELFTLSVLAVALGIAVGSAALFGVSVALGAFFAGMVVNGSDLSHEAATDALPLQDAFSVLFFVAVGMLFDPAILVREPLEVLAVLAIVMVGKSLGAAIIVLVFRHPIHTALRISASLAQVGEFSFILGARAVTLDLLPSEAQSLLIAAALLSISLNPLAFWGAERASRWLNTRPELLGFFEGEAVALAQLPKGNGGGGEEAPSEHAVVVGFGRVGGAIGATFEEKGIPYVGIEQRREIAEPLRAKGRPLLHGDATRPDVLAAAHVERARLLVVTAPDPFQARAVVEAARAANPTIETVVRAHSEDERAWLEEHGVGLALIGEHELALGLAQYALVQMGCGEEDAHATVDAMRERREPRVLAPA